MLRLCLHEENFKGGTEVSVKITCHIEKKRSCLKRRLCGHDGKKIDLKRREQVETEKGKGEWRRIAERRGE